MNPPILKVFNTVEEEIETLADFIVALANKTIVEKGVFSFVLSGGSSPQRLYVLLATSDYKNKVDWGKVDFFFGDERYVPVNHPESNTRMIKETLLLPLKIAENRIHAIDTSLTPQLAAEDYQKQLVNYFNGKPICFDFILLGLGDNAHTASLFPYTDVLNEKKPKVCAVFIEELNAHRITFTASLINQGYCIAFLVYGKNKAMAVHQVLGDKIDLKRYPAQLIEPKNGLEYWFLDQDAFGYNRV